MTSVKSLYIHIPFCLSKCAYCDFFSLTGFTKEGMEEYALALSREISFYLNYFNSGFLESVYIGGGTPSLLSFSALKTIFNAFRNNVNENTEITMEMNASDVTEESLLNAESLGVNRLSIGLQAFSDSALKISNRRGGRKDNLRSLATLKAVWKKNLSCDLIAALPLQSKEELFEGISILSENDLPHISLYSLTIEDGTPLFRMLEEGKLKYNFEEADKMWIEARDFLFEKGYEQ
ncbi:MAG: radical SAM protein, partial [Treponema sp.]|nr:radical SAM protein [Treponema sp.]